MSENFTSNQNKELLWGLLIEQNSFNGIETKHKSNIELVFERTIKIVETNLKNNSLVDKNKEVIKQMITYLNTLKRPQSLSQENKQNYTFDEIHKAKLERFDNELKKKQIEFESIIKKDAPNHIDFSDKIDEKIGDKMDLLISQTIAMRENQLKQILSETIPNKQTVDEISVPLFDINYSDPLSTTSSNVNNRDSIKLNIGEDIDGLLNQNIIVDLNNNTHKKVSFNENQNIYKYENELMNTNSDENNIELKTNPVKLNTFLNKLKQVQSQDKINEDSFNNEKINNEKKQNTRFEEQSIKTDNNKLDLIINLLNELNLKLDKLSFSTK